MTEQEFWKLIAVIDMGLVNEEDDFTGVEPLTNILAEMPPDNIKAFQESLTQKLYVLDSEERLDVSCGSDDGFLYQRCFLVASGQEVYEKAVTDVKFICDEIQWCEALLYVAEDAWGVNQETDWDYETSVSYETGSNTAHYK